MTGFFSPRQHTRHTHTYTHTHAHTHTHTHTHTHRYGAEADGEEMYEVPSLKGDEYSTMPTMAPAPAPAYASARTPASSSRAESQTVEEEASEEPVPDPYEGMGRLAIIKTLRNRGVDYSDLPNVDALRDKARETDLDYQAKLREKEQSKQQRFSNNTSVAISAHAQPSKELTGVCIDVAFCAGTLMGVICV
jgi:hypothetical protein